MGYIINRGKIYEEEKYNYLFITYLFLITRMNS